MSKREKLLQKIRNNPRGTRFSELQKLLGQFRFQLERIAGSHYIYRHPSGRMCNIQETGSGMAKTYQL
jgi:hypothetical protein